MGREGERSLIWIEENVVIDIVPHRGRWDRCWYVMLRRRCDQKHCLHGWVGGHGGHGGPVIVLKKKNKDDDNGILGSLEDIFGEIDLDYETFALILAAAGALASFVIFQTIQSKGRRSLSSNLLGGQTNWLDQLTEVVFHGKKNEQESN